MSETNPEAPRKVILFSGHMIDAQGRKTPRFPPDKEPIAAQRHSGGARRARRRAATFASAAARAAAIFCSPRPPSRATPGWSSIFRSTRSRFLNNRSASPATTGAPGIFAAKARADLHVLPDELGPVRRARTPTSATIAGCWTPRGASAPDKVDFLCLWNGEGGDGPGGTRHMMEEVAEAGGRTHVLETTKLWG